MKKFKKTFDGDKLQKSKKDKKDKIKKQTLDGKGIDKFTG
jgi:hypothetical protein